MQQASEELPSGLMSVFLGRTSELNQAMLAARKWCKFQIKIPEPIECEISNYLYHGCKVIGGNKEALDFIEQNYKEFNIKRIKRLPVTGAFHTNLMSSACENVKKILDEKVTIKRPLIKVFFNYNGESTFNEEKIKNLLVKQIKSPVKWEQILNSMLTLKNLPLTEEKRNELRENKQKREDAESEGEKPIKINIQPNDRIYPLIYECGPASQSGPILKEINKKAFSCYQHIGV
jgi:[acyl-carrier-protein] S-malonyltransferase